MTPGRLAGRGALGAGVMGAGWRRGWWCSGGGGPSPGNTSANTAWYGPRGSSWGADPSSPRKSESEISEPKPLVDTLSLRASSQARGGAGAGWAGHRGQARPTSS